MLYGMVVFGHIFGACGALVTGFLALNFPNGTRTHRMAGKCYLAMWLLLFVCGIIIGIRHWHVTGFQVLSWFSMGAVTYAYAMVFLRKRIGRSWLRRHYHAMVISMAGLVVATINQVLTNLGVAYPIWVFYLMVAAPSLIIPLYMRRLDRRYGFVKSTLSQETVAQRA